MVAYTQYKRGLLDGTDNTNGFSPSIWADANVELKLSEGLGIEMFDDFHHGTETGAGQPEWVIANATSGTAANILGIGGIVAVDAGSATDDQGVDQFQNYRTTTNLPWVCTAETKLYYECLCAIGDTPELCQFFAGLGSINTAMWTSGANNSTDHIGFEMNALTQAGTVGTAGNLNFYGEKGGTRNTAIEGVGLDVFDVTDAGTAGATIFADGAAWMKIGFIVNGVTDITVFVNGERTGDVIPTANIPTVGLVPSFSLMAEGSDAILQIDWVRVFQDRRPNA